MGLAVKRWLEDEYQRSVLSGTRVQIETRAPEACRGLTDRDGVPWAEYLRIAALHRVDQLSMSVLLRSMESATICAPHLPADPRHRDAPQLPLDGRKWGVAQKGRASLAQLLAYALVRCDAFRGIVLSLLVRLHGEDHANVVYIDRSQRPARVYLFEPNGPHAVHASDGMPRLREAVARANVLLERDAFDLGVVAPGLGVRVPPHLGQLRDLRRQRGEARRERRTSRADVARVSQVLRGERP